MRPISRTDRIILDPCSLHFRTGMELIWYRRIFGLHNFLTSLRSFGSFSGSQRPARLLKQQQHKKAFRSGYISSLFLLNKKSNTKHKTTHSRMENSSSKRRYFEGFYPDRKSIGFLSFSLSHTLTTLWSV